MFSLYVAFSRWTRNHVHLLFGLSRRISALTSEPVTEYDVALDQTPCPERELSGGEEIENVLDDAGILPLPELVQRLDSLIDARASRRAGEALRLILRSLGATPGGRALERALLGDGKSLAADAAEVGCTRQNLHHHVKTIRRKLRRLTPGTLIDTK